MAVTWRKELHFTCENTHCNSELLLDQMDAKTKKGMFAFARRQGWTWDERTLCPECSKAAADGAAKEIKDESTN